MCMGLSPGFMSSPIGVYIYIFANTILSWWLYLCSIVWNQVGWFLHHVAFNHHVVSTPSNMWQFLGFFLFFHDLDTSVSILWSATSVIFVCCFFPYNWNEIMDLGETYYIRIMSWSLSHIKSYMMALDLSTDSLILSIRI